MVRSGLFMAALAAARFNPDLMRFHNRLISNGKLPMVTLTAVMRKLVVLADTLLRDDRPWTAAPPRAETTPA